MSLMNGSFTDHYYGDRSTLERSEDRSGGWDWLGGLDELAHYVAMLGGYISPQSPASSAILDVGCGEGLLLPHVFDYTRRHDGIDGLTAVELAIGRRRATVDFRVVDMNDFVPDEPFNTIVFCESIYYLNPLDIKLRRYLDALTPEGVLLVSVHARRKHDYLWRKLDRLCETLDSVHVTDSRGTTWNVRAMQPKRER
jgi:predicted TPR repeat methyltransferase